MLNPESIDPFSKWSARLWQWPTPDEVREDRRSPRPQIAGSDCEGIHYNTLEGKFCNSAEEELTPDAAALCIGVSVSELTQWRRKVDEALQAVYEGTD